LITLKGIGISQLPGNNLVSFRKTASPLHHSVSVIQPSVQTEDVPEELYFSGTIGDEHVYVVYEVQPDNVEYTGNLNSEIANFASHVNTWQDPPAYGTGDISIQKGHMFNFASSTEADFREFFRRMAYPFMQNRCSPNHTNGQPIRRVFPLSGRDHQTISWMNKCRAGGVWCHCIY
jgi:hypothetical protein